MSKEIENFYSGIDFGPDDECGLDDTSYIDCYFNGSTIVYNGKGSLELINCHFNSAQFKFKSSAGNTLKMLAVMYNSGLHEAVERTFDSIRNGEYLEEESTHE